jgi:hypothetical protein
VALHKHEQLNQLRDADMLPRRRRLTLRFPFRLGTVWRRARFTTP